MWGFDVIGDISPMMKTQMENQMDRKPRSLYKGQCMGFYRVIRGVGDTTPMIENQTNQTLNPKP